MKQSTVIWSFVVELVQTTHIDKQTRSPAADRNAFSDAVFMFRRHASRHNNNVC